MDHRAFGCTRQSPSPDSQTTHQSALDILNWIGHNSSGSLRVGTLNNSNQAPSEIPVAKSRSVPLGSEECHAVSLKNSPIRPDPVE